MSGVRRGSNEAAQSKFEAGVNVNAVWVSQASHAGILQRMANAMVVCWPCSGSTCDRVAHAGNNVLFCFCFCAFTLTCKQQNKTEN